jgi:predicted acetylornithine/succinylornithine family transaminase
MKLSDIQKKEAGVYANTFGRLPLAVVRGKGPYLFDVNNRRFLDFFSGIAVNSLGHCHPKVVSAIRKQAGLLIHSSNWLYTLPQLELAERLERLSGLEKCFLTNDGSEAVECAIKLARKSTGKNKIIAMKNSFHGRTLGALSLTWEDKYRKPYEPLVPGMGFVDYNDIMALKRALTSDTAAVIMEPVQNEAGVLLPDEGFMADVRELTERKGVLLILDEIGTGLGRTGKMFAFQHEKVKPDILCLSKALGGGFPIGATLYSGMDFEKGEHGGTFVGNPLACAAALAAVKVIVEEKLDRNADKQGKYLLDKLSELGCSVRGKGLMIGMDVADGRSTVLRLIEERILTINSKNTVRILPPLIIKKAHCDKFIAAVSKVM